MKTGKNKKARTHRYGECVQKVKSAGRLDFWTKSAYSLHRSDYMFIIGQTSARKSMAGEATALAKPVMGTSVPAPAYRASRWYSPSAVSSTDRNTSVTEVAVAASCCVSPSACQPLAISCPTAQIPPPTTKASAVSLPMGELGDSCRTSASYSLGVTPSHPFAGNMCRFRRGYTCQNP